MTSSVKFSVSRYERYHSVSQKHPTSCLYVSIECVVTLCHLESCRVAIAIHGDFNRCSVTGTCWSVTWAGPTTWECTGVSLTTSPTLITSTLFFTRYAIVHMDGPTYVGASEPNNPLGKLQRYSRNGCSHWNWILFYLRLFVTRFPWISIRYLVRIKIFGSLTAMS